RAGGAGTARPGGRAAPGTGGPHRGSHGRGCRGLVAAMGRVRIDRLLVERGLAASRERARRLVMAGDVLVGERPVTKPGAEVPEDAPVRVRGEDTPFVSRGGEKLAGALDAFGLAVRGLVALDVGASTGEIGRASCRERG